MAVTGGPGMKIMLSATRDGRIAYMLANAAIDAWSVAARPDEAGRVTLMWAESSEEVLNRGTVRVCHHCSLPVSTQARFCRRCGTRQA